jgi:amino acid transporter
MSTPSTEQRSVFRRKPVEAFVTETAPDAEGGELSRSIGLFQLTMFGVGATIGTGIFIILAVLILFVIIAFTAFSGENFAPFAPLGAAGIGVAASSIFFTFIGLDAVSTAGEEVHNPRRTLPLAIVFATIIVTTVYILVAVAGIGA